MASDADLAPAAELDRGGPGPEDHDWIPGVSMAALSPAKQEYIARLRAAGLVITPATRDDLPLPEFTLPLRRSLLGSIWARITSSLRVRKVKHAAVP